MKIKNLEKAASTILGAIKENQGIVIYGDADLDGVGSTIILKEAIKTLGGRVVAVYFPDRDKEGYGVSEKALKHLKRYAPALFITLDCGIGNFKEIDIANSLGFKIIIVDHHEVVDGKIPKAFIVVDPKQKGDKYPFKVFANVGLTYKLIECLFKKHIPESLNKGFLELVAMATIADMMPRTGENDKMIGEGLNYLKSSWRVGIQALFSLKHFNEYNFHQKIYKVNSLLNVRDIKNKLPGSYRILSMLSLKDAKKLAEKLYKENLKRKERIKNIIEEADMKAVSKESDPVVFEGDTGWALELLGVACSNLVQKHKKPVFLYNMKKDDSHGSCRGISGINLVEAMKGFKEHLITFGGHPAAGGFRLKNKYLEDFKKHLISYFNSL